MHRYCIPSKDGLSSKRNVIASWICARGESSRESGSVKSVSRLKESLSTSACSPSDAWMACGAILSDAKLGTLLRTGLSILEECPDDRGLDAFVATPRSAQSS